VNALIGREMPRLKLDSTYGPVDLHELGRVLLVLFVYPHATGLPDPPVPEWDSIPGARGCTAESCGFRDQHLRFTELGAKVAGLSVQTVADQHAFAARVALRYPLISDSELALSAALDLPTFSAGNRTFYRRLTLIAQERVIVEVFDRISAPGDHAEAVARRLESQPAAEPAQRESRR
jgi:peroxiredoxin